MRKAFEIGGIVAAVVLIAFGIGAVAMGINGRSTVQSNLAQEQITFGDASKDPTVPAKYSGQLVNTGDKARAFAQMMRHHTLEATQGLTYSQMGRFAAKAGTPAKLTDGQAGRTTRCTPPPTRRVHRCRTRRVISGSPRPR